MIYYRNIVLHLIFLTSPLTISAQTITFLNAYGDKTGYSVQQTFDGGYIIVGEGYKIGTSYDVYLIKTDEFGDTLWTKTYGNPYLDRGYSVVQTSDSGYIIGAFVGVIDLWSEGWGNIYIIKTNSSGDTLWTRILDGGYQGDYAYSIEQTIDGGYIIAGVLNAGVNSFDYVAYLTKLSSDGDSLWTKTYGSFSYAFSVKQTIDRGYIFTGVDMSGTGTNLVKTDSIGDTIWTKTIQSLPGGIGYDVIITADSNFVITGHLVTQAVNDLFLCKIDNDGNMIWSKSYGGNSNEWGKSVDQCTDGGYIVVGLTSSFGVATTSSIWLLRTDANGDTLWTKTFGSTNDNEGYSVRQCIDGGFILTGDIYESGSKIFLIKTDSLGNIDSTVSVINTTPKKNKIHIYPNPGNKSLFINIKPQNTTKIKFKIFDIQGREIFTDSIKKYLNQYQLDISKFNKGIYIIQIKIGKENIYEKIVIE